MKTINDLRNLLLNVITEVKNGKLEVTKAQAICATANSIVNLTKLEMLYNGDDVGIEFMNNEPIEEPDADIAGSVSPLKVYNGV